jgi:hypothetical protein
MPELSQIVLQRLASRRAVGDHPDADTLTAYTEQLLPPGERNRVLEHVAACSYCREIVALSQPEATESLPVPAVALAPKRGWRWKPALGLAASLATLAAITTVVIELPRKPASFESARQSAAPADQAQASKTAAAPATNQPESLTANATSTPNTALEPSANDNTPRSAASGANTSSINNVAAARVMPVPPPPAVSATTASVVTSSAPRVAEARGNGRDYVNNQMFVPGQTANEPVPSVAEIPSAPLPRGLAENQFPPPLSSNAQLSFADIPPQAQTGKVLRSRLTSNPPNSHFGILIPNLPALGRKAERGVETMAKRGIAIQPGALSFSAMESTALAPSSGDQVQAETDDKVRLRGGDLDQSSAFSQRALAGGSFDAANNSAGSAAAWKVSGGNLLKSTDSTTWNAGYGPRDIEFTVVASRGANVWAGGANAALVHSANGGASWERITLGGSAAGSITSIEFGGASVRVKSSSGQEWSSQDGGRTWSIEK